MNQKKENSASAPSIASAGKVAGQIGPRIMRLSAGVFLFRQGDTPTNVFYISQGEVSVHIDDGEQVRELARLKAGSVFGEMALIEDSPRSASVKTETECELLSISPQSFQQAYSKVPKWFAGIIKLISNRLRHHNLKLPVSRMDSPLCSLASFIYQTVLYYPEDGWFANDDLYREYQFITGMEKDDFMSTLFQLHELQVISITKTNPPGVSIPDILFLEVFCEYYRHRSVGKSFPPFEISLSQQIALESYLLEARSQLLQPQTIDEILTGIIKQGDGDEFTYFQLSDWNILIQHERGLYSIDIEALEKLVRSAGYKMRIAEDEDL
jgi:CRP-like cAMP-binding protein